MGKNKNSKSILGRKVFLHLSLFSSHSARGEVEKWKRRKNQK